MRNVGFLQGLDLLIHKYASSFSLSVIHLRMHGTTTMPPLY